MQTIQVQIPPKALSRIGKEILQWIVLEAKKDAVWSKIVPRDPTFYESFKYKVTNGELVVFTTWPWMDLATTGMRSRKMTWLTRPAGVKSVPFMQRDGTVVFRATPLNTANAWIHPGIARHTFIDRAFKKATRRFATIIAQELGMVSHD
jgi:hypothetical protein